MSTTAEPRTIGEYYLARGSFKVAPRGPFADLDSVLDRKSGV